MYRRIKKHKKKIIVALLILIFIAFRFASRGEEENNDENQTSARKVTILTRGEEGFEARISTSGNVTSFQEAQIRAETTGNIVSVPARVGTSVSRGAVLASFDATDALNSVAQAEAGLRSAQAQLSQQERNSEGGSNTENIINQQDTIVQNAYRNLLNTDLQAYAANRAEETRANPPIISGTYNSLEEGEYVIETYASGTLSGASFRLSGLETETQSINAFDNPVLLGTRGLQIAFPESDESALTNQKWVIPIPNTRSSQYSTALNNYESAVAGKEVSLNQSIVSDDQLESSRAAVQQAEASLRSAQTRLARTSVRSPFAGEITNVNVKLGDFVNAGSPVATVVNQTELYVQAFVSNLESRRISVGDKVLLNNNISGTVSNVSSGINSTNGKVEVNISIDGEHNFISGEFIDVEIILSSIVNQDGTLLLPLQAVQPQLQGSVVYIIEDDVAKALSVETGRIVGEFIEVHTEISEDVNIAASARGLRDGVKVNIE